MKKVFFLFTVSLFLTSCGAYMNSEWTKENYQAESFKKIAVIAISKNLELRQNIENYVIEDLKSKKTLQTISGLSILPPNASKEDWSEENISKLLEKNGVDAVITVTPVNSYTSSDYTGGDAYTVPVYGRVGRRIYSSYRTVYTPGYYEQNQNYVIEANLYDLTQGNSKKDVMVWKGQSTVYDPSSIANGASDFSNNLVNYMIEKGIVK